MGQEGTANTVPFLVYKKFTDSGLEYKNRMG